jgi:hypothetical protein
MTERPAALYLSPNSGHNSIAARDLDCFGFLIGPRSYGIRGRVRQGHWWAMDNDCFNQFDEARWCEQLLRYWPHRARCLFVAMPDVVGDSAATLAQFPRYAPHVRAAGFPVALVTQDGLTPDAVPWNDLDALFIGGTDIHKRGPEGRALIVAAQQRNKWAHVGRVNSHHGVAERFWDAMSWDGTSIAFGPKWAPLFARAVRIARAKQQSPNLFGELAV